MYRTFNEYLVSKFGQNEADFIVDGCVETVIPMDESEANRIVVFYTGDMLSLSVFYGDFQRRHYKAMRAFIDTLKTVEKIEVLPYHTMGEVKYQKLGLEYPLKGIEPPTKERVQNAKNILMK